MLKFEQIVFGPIHSRRLGSSLGINLLPIEGKICNFDCIYCECGWNALSHAVASQMPSAADVSAALENKLKECASDGVGIDSITFSGNGEPTLHPEFPAIVDSTLSLRNSYCPGAAVSVLSNGTMLHRDEVISALRRVDNPILKLDAPDDVSLNAVNHPRAGMSVERIVEGLVRMNGDFILQTMFLKGSAVDFEENAELLEKWFSIVRRVRPRKIMVYTLDRPAPQAGLEKMPVETMKRLLSPLVKECFNLQING